MPNNLCELIEKYLSYFLKKHWSRAKKKKEIKLRNNGHFKDKCVLLLFQFVSMLEPFQK